jgi:thiol-disulfide isomerase/thioredoxin
MLEFFAVWCPVCHAEAPTIARITSQYASKGVRVWSILANPYGPNYDSSGRTDLTLATKQDLTWFAMMYHVQHPQLVDPNFKTVNTYGVNAYPGIYVVDKGGYITHASMGIQKFSTLSSALHRVLKTRGT